LTSDDQNTASQDSGYFLDGLTFADKKLDRESKNVIQKFNFLILFVCRGDAQSNFPPGFVLDMIRNK